MKPSPLLPIVCFSIVAAFAGGWASAQTTEYWDPGLSNSGATSGTGTWDASTTSDWYNTSAGTNPTTWSNGTSDTAVFNNTSTTTGYNVIVSGTVNVGTIDLSSTNSSGFYSFNESGNPVINGSSLTINNSSAAGFAAQFFNGIKFTATNYTFASSSGTGLKIINSSFNNNSAVTMNIGTGSDKGVFFLAGSNGGATGSETVAGDTINVNNNWTLSLSPNTAISTTTETQAGTINLTGFGAHAGEQNSYYGALQLNSSAYTGTAPGTAATQPGFLYNTTYAISGDTLITNSQSINGDSNNHAGESELKGGTISGTGNLYLAGGDVQATALTVSGSPSPSTVSSLIVATTGDTYTGATIIVNNTQISNLTTAQDPVPGIGYQDVALGVSNALSTTSELVLGTTNGVAAVSGATNALWTSDGTLDMAGFNQTFTGLATASPTASANYIGNNSGTGTSTLTIAGSSTPTTGFGGTIQDNLGTTGGKVALAVTSGAIKLTGANTYTGGTTVSGGVLTAGVAGTSTAGAIGTGAVSVTGGKLDLNNFSQTVGAVSLSGTGVLSLGITTTGLGTSDILSGTTASWAGGSSAFTLDLSTTYKTASALSFSSTLTESGTGPYTFTLYDGVAGQTYDLMTASNLSGLGFSSFASNGDTGTFGLSGNTLTFQVTSVVAAPEPSIWALLLGGVAMLGFVIRRRSFNT